MTKRSLNHGQRLTVEIIEKLGFGWIEQLSIRDGEPCYDRAPRIVQEIKLGADPERLPDHGGAGFTPKKEFENLFAHLERLHDAVVDIEIRHGIPFRLVLERCHTDFALAPADKP
jgi:hypothetical protein